jgi:hypothetical protein
MKTTKTTVTTQEVKNEYGKVIQTITTTITETYVEEDVDNDCY